LWKSEHQLILLSFFVLAFHNELEYCHLNARDNSTDASTSRKNLVNFGTVILEMTRLLCLPVYLYFAKISLPTSIHCTGIPKKDWTHAILMGVLTVVMTPFHLEEILLQSCKAGVYEA